MLDKHQSGSGGGRINIAATWEVNYWSTRWGITPDELFTAVAEVGTEVGEVRAYLAGQQELSG
jgi:Protein of unknown function (DUF3606)